MIHIRITEGITLPVEKSKLEQAVKETFQFTNAPVNSELTLVLSDDAQLHQLNRDFLGIDAPTDVLSFPADFTDPDSQLTYLGDILISVPGAIHQASSNQHSPQDELLLLAVHGTLHLLGFDHANDEEQTRMWSAQSQILQKVEAGLQ